MQFEYLYSDEAILSLIARHNTNNRPIAVDLETTGLDTRTCKILDIQITGYTEDSVFMFPGNFAPLLSKLTCPIVFHNMSYDLKVLHHQGIRLNASSIHDTMLLHHLIDENAEHGLGSIVEEHFGDFYKEKFWAKYDNYSDATYVDKLEYACKDVYYTLQLYDTFCIANLNPLLVAHVHKLALHLMQTEIDGIQVDLDYAMKRGLELQGAISELLPKIRATVETECSMWELEEWKRLIDSYKTDRGRARVPKPVFNFDSSKQLANLFYNILELPVQKNEKTRKPSVDDAALEKLTNRHPIVPLLRDYRGYKKVYNTYIEGTLEKAVGNRIYPSFNVNGTKTGRLSHANPNMAQLPSGGNIRGIYIPDSGYRFISADYRQLEVTLAAHFSQDENLLKIINEGISQHDITAEALGIDRSTAKTLNFAMQYLCSTYKVAKILNCSQGEAEYAYNKYWETYKGLAEFIRKTKQSIDATGIVTTAFGRSRRFPGESSGWAKEKAYRQGFNFLIQSTGGDLTNRALYLIQEEIGHRGKALFTVHDEVIVSAKEAYCGEVAEIVGTQMRQVGTDIKLSVPLSISISEPMVRWED